MQSRVTTEPPFCEAIITWRPRRRIPRSTRALHEAPRPSWKIIGRALRTFS